MNTNSLSELKLVAPVSAQASLCAASLRYKLVYRNLEKKPQN